MSRTFKDNKYYIANLPKWERKRILKTRNGKKIYRKSSQDMSASAEDNSTFDFDYRRETNHSMR